MEPRKKVKVKRVEIVALFRSLPVAFLQTKALPDKCQAVAIDLDVDGLGCKMGGCGSWIVGDAQERGAE